MLANYVLAVLLTLPLVYATVSELLLTISLVYATVSELRPQLNLQFLDPNPGANPPSYEVDIEAQLNYLFYSLTCKSPDNDVMVRITPSDQTTDFIDKDLQISDKAPGVQNCFPLSQSPPLNCSRGAYCETSNVCNVSLISVCPPAAYSSSWQMTQYLDIGMSLDQNRLYLLKCLAACRSASDGGVSGANSFPGYAIGAVAAGAVVLAIFGAVLFVLWRRWAKSRERALDDPKKRKVTFAP